jgi:hypothetical protein
MLPSPADSEETMETAEQPRIKINPTPIKIMPIKRLFLPMIRVPYSTESILVPNKVQG